MTRTVSGADTTADRLRTMIAAGEFSPGTQLSEERLSDQLGVSRNTLREAFRLLARDRLVEHVFNRGVFVRRLSAEDVADLYAARRVLEEAAVRACSPTSPALDAAAAAVTAARDAATAGDWGAVGTADIRFHSELVRAVPSARIHGLMDGLLAEMRLAFLTTDDPGSFHAEFVDRNDAIVAALRAGDQARASALLADYLDDAERTLRVAADAAG
ncbi:MULTISPECIES: GntR family transcriptional regulator [unclassified Curtobacterium]|uniref:GntR family transcriptional regulator n=1 Tax=unclassified Curtobacterium TaxID=257496 RepID=UPI000F469FF8|nr:MULTISPECIES: GntR family transcriptional regulator [unclassified Curtobacterium]ROQ03941.1 DNA-binding GntR family transcriptional regulator [Curtobacterium sp. PhB171]ROQ19012.1 DNA-binding GntR family transcriptional regulator [Curtobacterium sp. PhB170]ROS32581.1 DNA-binding GntR family transcriptional regulator [Curtobacterium sp. PhB131]ROS63651.1 DNA-binding GntR family transcriptional regulator [Curtobacterium sp. PhB141]